MDGFECIVISTNAVPKAASEEKSCKGNRKISLPMLFIGIEMTEGKNRIETTRLLFVIPNVERNLMRDHNYFVYILTNWNNKVMYIGMTNDLERRLYEHKNKLVEGFTKRYNIHKLVYYEHTTDVYEAIAREKEIKKWRREKKNRLVETMNPEWNDLSCGWF